MSMEAGSMETIEVPQDKIVKKVGDLWAVAYEMEQNYWKYSTFGRLTLCMCNEQYMIMKKTGLPLIVRSSAKYEL